MATTHVAIGFMTVAVAQVQKVPRHTDDVTNDGRGRDDAQHLIREVQR